jgi:hypothetical protein
LEIWTVRVSVSGEVRERERRDQFEISHRKDRHDSFTVSIGKDRVCGRILRVTSVRGGSNQTTRGNIGHFDRSVVESRVRERAREREMDRR